MLAWSLTCNFELYKPWERTDDFYKMATTYRDDNRLIECYQKDSDCEMEEE